MNIRQSKENSKKKMDNPSQMQDMFWESSNYSGLFKIKYLKDT